jgi:S-sulfo-L-cysteine synthase (3-phospho-L-serine-dependent)
MSSSTIHADIVEALALPRIVMLRPNLFGLVFPLMKLLPASFMIEQARREGVLSPGGLIAETTSGTLGLALAMVARLRNHPLTIVSDPAIDPPLRRRLEDLGATVHIVTAPAQAGGYQRARLDVLECVLAENPGSFCPRQYSNRHNPESYAPCAEQLAQAVGPIDCLVGTVGSGGSVCGMASYLRLLFPKLIVTGVDTHGSVLFGQSDAGAGRLLRGLGNGLMPPNVDHTAFDWVHWVGAAEAFRATRQLHRDHALFMGPTSGAAYLAADWWARENPDCVTAVIFPDEGYRYLDTVYNDAWLQANHVRLDALPSSPLEWMRPQDGSDGWTHLEWRRRGIGDVIGIPSSAEERVTV